MTGPDVIADGGAQPLYASFSRRLNAMSLDALIVIGFSAVIFTAVSVVEGIVFLRVGLLVLWWGVLLFYDPVQVWRFGGTLGHRLLNLRVVDDTTGANVGLVKAIFRTLLKGFLGVLTFVTMSFSRRHLALHDMATSTSVQIRDPDRALPHHYVVGRQPPES